MDMRKFGLQEWLKAEELPDGGMDVTITDVYTHVFPPGKYSTREQEKTVLNLVEWPYRPCPLNATNTTACVGMFGPSGEDWKGKRLRLDKSPMAGGKWQMIVGPAQVEEQPSPATETEVA